MSSSVVRYVTRRPRDEVEIVSRIHQLAFRHGRYGCCRVTALLKREGCNVNRKREHRIWKAEELNLPGRRPKVLRAGPPSEVVDGVEYPTHVWRYDFLEDQTGVKWEAEGPHDNR
ncbi:IS3 family transposase [Chloroflexota bacterium]